MELSSWANFWRSVPYLFQALRGESYLRRGLKYTINLNKGGVPIYDGVTNLQTMGTNKVEAFASNTSMN